MPPVTTPDQQVDGFLARHLAPPPGRATKDVKERILSWLAIANNPHTKHPDASAKILADIRRKARQNVRRLVKRHPDAAVIIDAMSAAETCR